MTITAGLTQVADILRDARTDLAIDLLHMEIADAKREIEMLEASVHEHRRLGAALLPADPANDDRKVHRAMASYLGHALESARDLHGNLQRRMFQLCPPAFVESESNYLDAVNRDEERIAAHLGRGGCRYVGD